MEPELPRINLRNLVSTHKSEKRSIEDEFESNYPKFADCLINHLAASALNGFSRRFLKFYHSYPKALDEYSKQLNLDITNNINISKLQKATKLCKDLTPFKNWVERCSKNQCEAEETRSFLQNSMKRVAAIAEKKLNELFFDYTAQAASKILRYQISYSLLEIGLKVSLWIEDGNWPAVEQKSKDPVSNFFRRISLGKEERLPVFDMRGLVAAHAEGKISAELDFENNYYQVVDILSKRFAKMALRMFEDQFKDPLKNYPTCLNAFTTWFGFDLSEARDLEELITFTKPCENLSPFKEWFKVLKKQDKSLTAYFQEFFNRIGNLTVEKLNDLYDNYRLDAAQNILNFDVRYCSNEFKLFISLWIEQETSWPDEEDRTDGYLRISSTRPFSLEDFPTNKKILFEDYFKDM